MFGATKSSKINFRTNSLWDDEEVRSLLNEATKQKLLKFQSNRETHKLIAEALLEIRNIEIVHRFKSLYETEKMPETSRRGNLMHNFMIVKSKYE